MVVVMYNNSYDWLNELDNNIKKIIKENKVQNIFLCKNNEYNDIYHYKIFLKNILVFYTFAHLKRRFNDKKYTKI